MQHRDFSSEFIVSASRSGGPGGQNVNKVSSKIELRFHVDGSQLLTDEEKAILKEKAANKITGEGFLQIIAQAERSQLLNKQVAVRKFYQLLEKCFTPVKARKPTKPTKAVVRQRLESKRKASQKKAFRGPTNFKDD